MQLAYALDGEIISADSVQIYRGFDIGSAKPSAAEQAAVAHHLINIRDAAEVYSAADFMRDAGAAIADIVARGKMPIVCGGTGLYVRSLLYGLAQAAPADAGMRALIEARIAADGLAAAHAWLSMVDAGRWGADSPQRPSSYRAST
jgi:tRNA dimethylallyltransferase